MLQDGWALTEKQKNFGCLRSHRGALPLCELHLEVEWIGLDYRLKVRQTFLNVHEESIEAIYTFALPTGAAVTHCAMDCGERSAQGELRDRGEARKLYKEAVRGSQQAALVEAERPEVFTMTVGNLPARQRVEIQLEVVGPLLCRDSWAVFRFPLVVAPRHIPGQPLNQQDVGQGTSPDTHKTPDASRITPPVLLAGYPNPVVFSLEITVDSMLWDAESMRCSLRLEVDGNRLYYVPSQGGIDHDLILALPFRDQLQSSLMVEDSGIFCLTVGPSLDSNRQREPMQLALLVDCSGAMVGWPLEAARRCATALLSHLSERDSFALLTFADTASSGVSQPASDSNCGAALELLESVSAAGACQLAPALRAARGRLDPGARLVVLTQARVGNEAEVLSLCQGLHLSVVGLGPAVNAGLLEQMGSFCRLAQNEVQLESALHDLTCSLYGPALSRLEIQGAEQLAPQPGDIFPGQATRIYGRLEDPESLRIPGLKLELRRRAGNLLTRLWARQRLLQMEYAYQMRRADSPTPYQIIKFSLEQGVLSRFTALVAVDQSSRVPIQAYTLVQAVEPVRETVVSHNYSGTIKVDLLPTEKRGFQVDPLKLVLVIAALLALLYFLLGRG